MQRALFPETPSPSKVCKQPKNRKVRRRQDSGLTMTLFGPLESKSESARRARKIVELLGFIEEAPEAIHCCEHDVWMLSYFIERSEQKLLDPNDRDGLIRLVGDLEELLSEEDCQEMLDDRSIWRAYPPGWLGMGPGDRYAVALHGKEIAYLRKLATGRRQDQAAIIESTGEWQV